MGAEDIGDAIVAAYMEKEVVLDCRGPFVYLGRLTGADAFFFTLEDVDVHDMHDGHTPKEKYILDARSSGIKKNRKKVHVRRDVVVSLSLLEDVIDF